MMTKTSIPQLLGGCTLVATLIAGAGGVSATDTKKPHQHNAPPGISAEILNQRAEDARTVVEFPPAVFDVLKQEMHGNLLALNQILAHLATDNLEEAAAIAEQKLGNSARGKHRGTGLGPGRHKPQEMRAIGHELHEAGSTLATAIESGDMTATFAALQQVSATCIACHSSYRAQIAPVASK